MLSSRQVPTMAASPRGVGACAPHGGAESTANTPTMTEPSRDMGAPGDGLLRDASAVGPLGALALPAPAPVGGPGCHVPVPRAARWRRPMEILDAWHAAERF